MLRIKICGLTNLADAYMALKLGADFLGFNNIRRSKRFIDILDIKDIVQRMPESLRDKCVLLAEDVDLQSIIKTAKSLVLILFNLILLIPPSLMLIILKQESVAWGSLELFILKTKDLLMIYP